MALVEKTLAELESIARLSDAVWYRGRPVAEGGLPLVFTVEAGPTFFGLNFDEFFDPDTAKIRASALPARYTDAEAITAVEGEATLAFQQATTVSTTAGDLTLSPAGDIVLGADIKMGSFDLFGGAASSVVALYGGAKAAGGGALVVLRGSNSATPITFYTPNAAKDADVIRLSIVGNQDSGSGEIQLYEDLVVTGDIHLTGTVDGIDIAAHAAAAGAHHAAFVQADADLLYEALGGLATHEVLDTGVHGAGASTLATVADITTHTGDDDAHHDLVTLAADAQELLNLSTQEIGFVAKAANLVLAGPVAGGAADPTFRALVLADIATAALGTGTPDGTKFLRDDRTWQTPAGGAPADAPYITWGTAAGLSAEKSIKGGDTVDLDGADAHFKWTELGADRQLIVENDDGVGLARAGVWVKQNALAFGQRETFYRGSKNNEANPRVMLQDDRLYFGTGAAVANTGIQRIANGIMGIVGSASQKVLEIQGGSPTDPAAPASGVRHYVRSIAGSARAFVRAQDGKVFGPLGTWNSLTQFQRSQVGLWHAPGNATLADGGWGLFGGMLSAGTPAYSAGAAGRLVTTTTGGVIGNDAGFYTSAVMIRRGSNPALQVKFVLSTITNVRMFIGLSDQTLVTMVGADDPAGHYMGIQFSTDRPDTNWQLVTKDNVTQAIEDSGVAATTGVWWIRMAFDGVNIAFELLDSTYTVVATKTIGPFNIPGATADLRYIAAVETRATATRSLEHYYSGLAAAGV